MSVEDTQAHPATETLEALVERAKRNKRGYSCRNDRFLALVEELARLRGIEAAASKVFEIWCAETEEESLLLVGEHTGMTDLGFALDAPAKEV